MMRKRVATLVLSGLMVLANCESCDSTDKSTGDSGSGGNQVDGEAQTESSEKIPCQSGFQCTAPKGIGAFVCTEPAGLPPLCVDHRDCDLGPCTQIEGQGYCMQSCGPTPVEQCPTGTVCNAFGSGYVCTQSDILSPPSCNNESCPFGECLLSYDANSLCILPCEVPVVDQCPQGTVCAPFGSDLFYCARPSTGLPDTCASPSEPCSYGICFNTGGTNYCTQGCIPPMVDTCPNDTVCRSIGTYGWICSDKTSALPPVCQSQADCAFGSCIRNGDKSYCTEYCSKPGIDITGTVYGMNGAIAGVKVCVFENNVPNENLCAMTGTQGEFAIYNLPEELFIVLSTAKDGYQSSLQLAIPNSLTSILIFTEEEIASAAQTAAATYPSVDAGMLAFLALDATGTPVSGYNVSIRPAAGSGPFYNDANNALDISLTSSSASGWGVFFDLPEDYYSLDFSHASATCNDLSQILIVNGYLSTVVTGCL